MDRTVVRTHLSYVSVLAVAAPLAVSGPGRSATEVRVAAGAGSYEIVTRGCDNTVLSKRGVDFDNVGVEASHKFPNPVRLGVRAGAFSLDDLDATRYVNPYVSFDWHGFSLGGGWVGADGVLPDGSEDDLLGDLEEGRTQSTGSGHVRIGTSKLYFSASYYEGVPLLTPGQLAAGFGGGKDRLHVWAGVSVLPYDNLGLLASAEVATGEHLGFTGTGRFGKTEGETEGAFALGLRFRWGGETGRAGEPTPRAAPVDSSAAR